MKKERMVVICICTVLLGSLWAQGIAWTCYFAMPSTAQIFWPVPFDIQFVKAEPVRLTATLSDSIVTFVCSGWPHLGFLYGESRLLRQEIQARHARKDRVQGNSTPEVLNRLRGMTMDPSTATLQRK